MKKKIVSVVGARPQFIKAAGLSPMLRRSFKEIIVHTGQHYDYNMSQVFFSGLKIPKPDYNLHVGSASHATQTAKMIIGIEKIVNKEKPAAILVYGDTNSTLAGALVGAKMDVPVIHVEAGARSFDNTMPEEQNRKVADNLSRVLFCVDELAKRNLKAEGIDKNVYITGNLMEEVLRNVLPKSKKLQKDILNLIGLVRKQYIYLTLHRASNTDNKKLLSYFVKSIAKVPTTIVFPVHPRTKKMLQQFGLWSKLKSSQNIVLVEPANYMESVALQEGAKYVITDSGGIQNEAYWLNVPCITLRDSTEWPKTVASGWNKLVPLYERGLYQKLISPPRGGKKKQAKIIASQKIIKHLKRIM
jgi:UDP-N-acetylglucosamine 2-epimerase